MEITHKRRPRLRAVASQFLLGIAGVALITYVCFRLGFGMARTAFALFDFDRLGFAAGHL